MDVKSAFLYGTIEEEVSVTQPPGFKHPDHLDKVYKVVKALYRLHQAPRAWYETLANYLLGNGFKRGKIDQTLFIKKQKGDILLVQVYVDDIIFGSTNKELCTAFEKLKKDKFQMSSIGELTFFLGLKTSHLLAVRRIFRYLKGKPSLGLWYSRDSPFELVAYTDSDYAGATLDRKSTTRGASSKGFDAADFNTWLVMRLSIRSWEQKERAATPLRAISLEAEQESDTILGDVNAQTRFEITSKQSIDPPLSRGYTLGSWEDIAYWNENWMITDVFYLNVAQFLLNAANLKLCCRLKLVLSVLVSTVKLNPVIYTYCIEQFWVTAKVQTVNGVRQIQALVDKKRVIVTESSIGRDLHLDDAEGTDCLPTATIFEELRVLREPEYISEGECTDKANTGIETAHSTISDQDTVYDTQSMRGQCGGSQQDEFETRCIVERYGLMLTAESVSNRVITDSRTLLYRIRISFTLNSGEQETIEHVIMCGVRGCATRVWFTRSLEEREFLLSPRLDERYMSKEEVVFKIHTKGYFEYDPLRNVNGLVSSVSEFTHDRDVFPTCLDHIMFVVDEHKWALFYRKKGKEKVCEDEGMCSKGNKPVVSIYKKAMVNGKAKMVEDVGGKEEMVSKRGVRSKKNASIKCEGTDKAKTTRKWLKLGKHEYKNGRAHKKPEGSYLSQPKAVDKLFEHFCLCFAKAIMDVKSAFLYGKIEEEVYVCQPPGFEDPEFPNKVYKVEKALYGLHQAPRAWYETLSTYLLDNGFQRGLQVTQKDDGIFISQDKYVDEILKKFGFSTVKTASTPMETSKPLLKDAEAEDIDFYLYRSMIGSLMYLTASRPDIMFVVCACARFQVTPKVSHLHAVKRIFRYLKDRKSTTGGCQFLRSRLISWQCKKQTIVANSTTEAEYVAATNCRGGKGFSGRVTPLFQTMMVQAPKELGKGSEILTDPQHTSTIIQPSTSQPQKKQPRRKQRKDTDVSQPSGSTEPITNEAANEEHVPTHSNDPLLSVRNQKEKAKERGSKEKSSESATRPTRGVTMQEPSEFGTRKVVPPSEHDLKDKGKAKMIKPEKPLKKKDQIKFDEEVAKRLVE
ncbi:putative ribonuclease H-like domain-containing protein [Tanacetum coccineum]